MSMPTSTNLVHTVSFRQKLHESDESDESDDRSDRSSDDDAWKTLSFSNCTQYSIIVQHFSIACLVWSLCTLLTITHLKSKRSSPTHTYKMYCQRGTTLRCYGCATGGREVTDVTRVSGTIFVCNRCDGSKIGKTERRRTNIRRAERGVLFGMEVATHSPPDSTVTFFERHLMKGKLVFYDNGKRRNRRLETTRRCE